MRAITFCVVLLLIFPCLTVDSAEAEYELFKEILGHPLYSGHQNMAVDKESMLWVCSGGLVFRHDGTNWEDFLLKLAGLIK